jgi:hypothetical protein
LDPDRQDAPNAVADDWHGSWPLLAIATGASNRRRISMVLSSTGGIKQHPNRKPPV